MSALHCGQWIRSLAPHSEQNFRPVGFSDPHFEQSIEAPTRTTLPTPLVSPNAASRHRPRKADPRRAPCSVKRRRSSFERDVEMRGTEQQTKRNVQLLELVHRLGLDRGFVSLLGDFMITAAIPVITNASKSISIFWSCAAPGLRCPRDSSSVFRLAIARTPPRPDRTFVLTLRASRIPLPAANERQPGSDSASPDGHAPMTSSTTHSRSAGTKRRSLDQADARGTPDIRAERPRFSRIARKLSLRTPQRAVGRCPAAEHR